MYYNLIKTPAVIKSGHDYVSRIDEVLNKSHLFYPEKIFITQENLYSQYQDSILKNDIDKVIFCKGGNKEEAESIIKEIKGSDALIIAFGGGSVLDIVKYCASLCDLAYITVPSTLSNDAIYSCVARLTENGKKKSFGVQPPTGIIIDLDVIRQSPKALILAGVGDLISNISALEDWKLAHKMINEPIDELAFILSKQAAVGLFDYSEDDIYNDSFLLDLANGLISSGLSMIKSGNTRGTSGAEHMISHAIDEYFPEKSTIHGIQVAWAFLMIEKHIRKNMFFYQKLKAFYTKIGLNKIIEDRIPWKECDLESLIPYARIIRNRYTIFNTTNVSIQGLCKHSKFGAG